MSAGSVVLADVMQRWWCDNTSTPSFLAEKIGADGDDDATVLTFCRTRKPNGAGFGRATTTSPSLNCLGMNVPRSRRFRLYPKQKFIQCSKCTGCRNVLCGVPTFVSAFNRFVTKPQKKYLLRSRSEKGERYAPTFIAGTRKNANGASANVRIQTPGGPTKRKTRNKIQKELDIDK